MNVPFLSRLRRARWVHVLQLLVFTCWVANPFPGALSYWTDTNGDRVKEEVANPAEGDSWFDQDADGDSLTNAQEALFGSDPYQIDADFDGLRDDAEQQLSDPTAPFDPWKWDSNDNGFSDHDELYQRLHGYTPVVNYATLAAGSFFSYSDADGDSLKNHEDSDPLNMDRDNDGVLNWNDTGYMDDANNGYVPPPTDPNGGTFYPDSDGDGTVDPYDPFPNGSFWYNGTEYGGAWSDRDNDAIPDPADSFPDGSYWWNGTEHAGAWVDQDGDQIPDAFDPWPTIAGSFWWMATEYPGAWVDSDSDQIPDAFDSYPSGSYWYNSVEYGGTWSDADNDTIPDPADATPNGGYWYNNVEYAGAWVDADNDGIPDAHDALPNDWWNGAPHFNYNGTEYAGDWIDRDNDTIPDAADAYPDDAENNADNDGDGLSNYAENTQHGTDPGNVDSDGEGLTDFEELYTYHTNPLAEKTNPNQPYTDYYTVDQTDTDGDQIPDRIEQWYASQNYGMNPNDANDALGDLDGDGYSNRQAYFNGWNFTAHLNQYDNDADGILDVLEDTWNASYPGILSSSNFSDAVQDYDNDGLMNFEEVALGLNPGNATSRITSVGDLQEWAWRGIIYQTGVIAFSGGVPPEWNVVNDTDDTHAPDGLESFVAALNANSALVALPQRLAGGDYDGDGMPDVWEHQYRLNLRDAGDAQNNNDGDSLTNLQEFTSNPPRDPLVDDDPPPPELTLSANVPNGAVGEAYSATFTASGGTPGYTYSVSSGTLPDGLSLDSSAGVISGTPQSGGMFDFFVSVNDSSGQNTSMSCQITITGLEISTSTLPAGFVLSDYSASLSAVHGNAPYTFSVPPPQDGETGLPFGYSLQESGTLTGYADSVGMLASGMYAFSVEVADNAGRTARKQFALLIVDGLFITGGGSGGGTTTGQQGGGGATTTTTTTTTTAAPPVITLAGRYNAVGFSATPSGKDEEYGTADETDRKAALETEGFLDVTAGSDASSHLVRVDEGGMPVYADWKLERGRPGTYSYNASGTQRSEPEPILSDKEITDLIAEGGEAPEIDGHLAFDPPEPNKSSSTDAGGLGAGRGSHTEGLATFKMGSWKEFWLKASAAVPEAVSRTYLIRKTSGTGDNATEQITAVTLTIPKNGTHSTQGTNSTASDINGRDGTIKLHPAEGESMSLLPVEIESRDRAVTGKIPHLGKMMGNKPFKIGFKAGSKNLGTLDIPESGSPQGVTIYENADDEKTGIFGDDELADPAAAHTKLKNQEVVLAREGDDIRFYTVSDSISKFTVSLYVDGSKVADIDHDLERDDEFGVFIGAVEKFVAGDAPPGIGSGPAPIILAAAPPPAMNAGQTQQLLALVPASLQEIFPQLFHFTVTTSPSIDSPEVIAARASTAYAEAFLVWLHEAKEALNEDQWAAVSILLGAAGYDTNAAMAPRLAGWNPPQAADNTSLLPEVIRNRALVAKVLISWMRHSMKIGVSGGKGVVYGLWDGLKSEWEDIKQFGALWDALKHPYQSASELYHTFKMIKNLDGPALKAIATNMYTAFLASSVARLEWTEPAGIEEALSMYITGYMYGYITEQVAVAVIAGYLTGGAALAIKAGKAGKILRTIFEAVEKFKNAVKVAATVRLVEGRLPKIFVARLAKIVRTETDLRTVRNAAGKLARQGVPALETDISKCLTAANGNNQSGLRAWYKKRSIDLGSDEAHHLIPYENCNHDLVQRASRGGFNMNNGDHNGLALSPEFHRPPPNRNHPEYRAAMRQMLDDILLESTNISDAEAADILNRAAQVLREVVLEANIPLAFNKVFFNKRYLAYNSERRESYGRLN